MVFDYLVVGSGLFGSIFAREMVNAGKTVLILEKRKNVGGNIFSEQKEEINVHLHGPHLFHTKNEEIWNYVRDFVPFNNYRHKVKAIHKGKIYSLPFNMNTFNQLWGVVTPDDAKRIINKQKIKIENPANLEEQALATVGEEIYEKLIKGYTQKQWRRDPKTLPAFIIKRLPLRFTYNDDYFEDNFQGVPINGYTNLIENIIKDIPTKTGEDFFDIADWHTIARKLVYSGPIDRFFNYSYGHLEYLTLEFQFRTIEGNFQGVGQMNYTSEHIPFTRIIEFKHFMTHNTNKSIVAYEYPVKWEANKEPYYPVNDEKNNAIYKKYHEKALGLNDVIFGGRLATFQYLDMAPVIAQALHAAKREISE